MKYFTVEEGRIEANIETHAVDSGGGWCSEGETLEDKKDILLWYRVIVYNEDDLGVDVVYYNVCDDGEHSDADEVLERIKKDYPPTEYQNNDW